MDPYVASLQTLFEQNADPTQAVPMKKYMRDQFEYLGIKTPKNVALQKEFFEAHGFPPLSELEIALRDLWSLPPREFQYVAVGRLGRFNRQIPAKFIKTIEYMLITKSWWDTIDSIAGGTVGVQFQRFPEVREKVLPKWRASDNFWL